MINKTIMAFKFYFRRFLTVPFVGKLNPWLWFESADSGVGHWVASNTLGCHLAKIRRKCYGLLLIFALILSLVPCPAAAEGAVMIDQDKLKAFGILRDDADMERLVTRGEFALIVSELNGTAELGGGGEMVFVDVPPTHQYAKSISLLADLGYVSGGVNRRFFPDQHITYGETATIMIRLLGYKVRAEAGGGYPAGYQAEAATLRIIPQGGMAFDQVITLRQIYAVIEKCLEVPLLEQTVFGKFGRFTAEGGETLLSAYKGIYKYSAQVTRVGKISLNNNGRYREYTAEIGQHTFVFDELDMFPMLGYKCNVYFTLDEPNNEYNIIYIEKAGGAQSEMVIGAHEIEDIDSSMVSVLSKDARISRYTLALGAQIVFNDRLMTHGNVPSLKPEVGFVRLIDNTGDGVYDVAFIDSYTNYFVLNASESEQVVQVTDGVNTKTINYDDYEEYSQMFLRGGREAEMGDIGSETLISVGISENKDYIKTIINEKVVNGVIEEISEQEIKAGGQIYPARPMPLTDAKVGQVRNIYLDVEGYVSWIGNITDGKNTKGYLLRAALEEGVQRKLTLKILSENGDTVTAEVAQTVMVNSARKKLNQMVEEKAVWDFDLTMEQNRKVILFSQNEQGHINSIVTPVTKGTAEPCADVLVHTFLSNVAGGRTYRTAARAFDEEVVIGDETVVFVTSTDYDDDKYRVLKAVDYFANDYKYNIDGYNISDNLYVDIITRSVGIAVSNGNTPILVTDISTCYENDNNRYKIYGISNGDPYYEGVTVPSGDIADKISTVSAGDVVQVQAGQDGYIFNIAKVFDYSQLKSLNDAKDEQYNLMTRYCEIDKVKGPYIQIINSDGKEERYSLASAKLYIFDMSGNTAKLGSTADLLPGQKAFFRVNRGVLREVIVYSNQTLH